LLTQISDNVLKTLAILFAADSDSESLMISSKTVLSYCLEKQFWGNVGVSGQHFLNAENHCRYRTALIHVRVGAAAR